MFCFELRAGFVQFCVFRFGFDQAFDLIGLLRTFQGGWIERFRVHFLDVLQRLRGLLNDRVLCRLLRTKVPTALQRQELSCLLIQNPLLDDLEHLCEGDRTLFDKDLFLNGQLLLTIDGLGFYRLTPEERAFGTERCFDL